MGLEMAVKKSLTRENAARYAKASKKEKTKILDEHCATTGYNRKYAIAEFNRLVQIRHGISSPPARTTRNLLDKFTAGKHETILHLRERNGNNYKPHHEMRDQKDL